MRIPALGLLLTLAAAPLAAQDATAAPTAAVSLTDNEWILLGRQITVWFFAGQTDSLLAHMEPDAARDMHEGAGLIEMRDQLASRAGSEVFVISDKMTKRRGHPQYWRESKYETGPNEPLVLRFVFNDAGQVIGIGMGPLSGTPAPDAS